MTGSAARVDRAGWLPWSALWRQSRRDVAPLAVGMAVIASAAFLSAVVPQAEAGVATAALRAAVAEPSQPVELVVSVPLGGDSAPDPGAAELAATIGGMVEAGVPAELRAVLTDPITVMTGPELKAGVIAGRPGRVEFSYAAGAGQPALDWVEGRPPAATGDPTDLAGEDAAVLPVEVAMSQPAAELMGVGAGDRLPVTSQDGWALDVRLSGVYQAADPADDLWAVAPTLLQPRVVGGAEGFVGIGLLLSAESLPFGQAALAGSAMSRSYTYRVDASRLDVDTAPTVAAQARALASGRQVFEISGAQPVVTTGLDTVLDDTLARISAASAQASVLLLGVLSLALLVVFLTAGLAVERRAAVLALWRSRGATLPAIGLAQAGESVLLTALAGAVGLVAAQAVAGGSPPPGWVLPPLLAALVPGPLLAVRAARAAGRPPLPSGTGPDAAALRRVAAEATLALLALAALATLVARGVAASADSGWADAVVLCAPVLVAAAAGLALVRVQPRLSAAARSLAERRPGLLPLLVAVRARGSGAAVVTLVVAGTLVAIAGSAGLTVEHGRAAASWDVVGADAVARTTASAGLPPEVAGLDGSAGLTAATATVIPGAQLLGAGLDRPVTVIAVDSAALGRLLAITPAPDAPVLGLLQDAGGDALPVLGANLPGWDAASLRWGKVSVRVRAVGEAPSLPGQPAPGERGAVVVDRDLLARATGQDLPPDGGWVVGPDAGPRLRAAVAGAGAVVVTRQDWLATQRSAPLQSALAALFGWAVVIAAALAGLAVVLAAASGAEGRRLATARLQVLGTPQAGAARVAWLEPAVPAVVASLAGLLVGTGLAGLLVGALDLRSVTGGASPPPLVIAWWSFVLPVGLGGVALLAVVAGAAGRREDLGSLLRGS